MYIYKRNRIPFFSIILSTYNRAYILDKAIRSVINQTETDWELIIVDDGSNDDTSQICLTFCKEFDNIRYMYHNNKGLPHSRNAGALAASGLYLTFLDSDDEYKPDHLDLRKKILFQNPELDLLYGGVEVIGDPYVVDYYNESKKIHLDECYIGGTFFFKRNEFIEIEGFREIPYGEDTELALRAISLGLNVASIDLKTYVYNRTLPDSICNQKSKNNL